MLDKTNPDKEFRAIFNTFLQAKKIRSKDLNAGNSSITEDTKLYYDKDELKEAIDKVEKAVTGIITDPETTLGIRRKASLVYNWLLSLDKARSCYETGRVLDHACSFKCANAMVDDDGFLKTIYLNIVGDLSE